jgi:hypothetical protein
LLIVVSQKGALMTSLAILPLAFSAVIRTKAQLFSSGILAFIFVIVYIGGLVVLLVRLTSLLSAEQIDKSMAFKPLVIAGLRARLVSALVYSSFLEQGGKLTLFY